MIRKVIRVWCALQLLKLANWLIKPLPPSGPAVVVSKPWELIRPSCQHPYGFGCPRCVTVAIGTNSWPDTTIGHQN